MAPIEREQLLGLMSNIDEDTLLMALKGVRQFVITKGEDRTFWDAIDQDPDLERILTTERKNLGGKSIMGHLRDLAEKQPDMVEKILGIERPIQEDVPETPKQGENTKHQRNTRVHSGEWRERDTVRGEVLPPWLAFLAKEEDVDKIREGTTVVHISTTPLLKRELIERIINNTPNLEAIQVSPSLLNTHVGQGIKDFLEKHGKELRVGRVVNLTHYDQPYINVEMVEKSRFFLAAMENPKNVKLLDLLNQYEFEGPELARLAFGGPEPVTMAKIKKETGLEYAYIQRKINTIFALLGYPTTDQVIKLAAKNIPIKLARLQNAEHDREAYKTLREGHKVEGFYPPDKLPTYRWEGWKKVYEFLTKNPSKLEILKEKHYFVISTYYGLNASSPMNLTEIGEALGITRERVRQIRDSILQKWGLFENDSF